MNFTNSIINFTVLFILNQFYSILLRFFHLFHLIVFTKFKIYKQ